MDRHIIIESRFCDILAGLDKIIENGWLCTASEILNEQFFESVLASTAKGSNFCKGIHFPFFHSYVVATS